MVWIDRYINVQRFRVIYHGISNESVLFPWYTHSVLNFTNSELTPLTSVRVFVRARDFRWPRTYSRLHLNFASIVIFQIFIFVVFSCGV